MKYKVLQNTAFFGLLIVTTVLFLRLLIPVLQPLIWASILGVVFYPWYRYVRSYINFPSLASLLTIIILLVVVFAPLYGILTLLAKEAVGLYHIITDNPASLNDITTTLSHALSNTPLPFDSYSVQTKLVSMLKLTGTAVATAAFSLGKMTTQFIIQFLLMLYILFYVFRDGKKFLHYIQHLLPLGTEREDTLFARFASITRAIFKGTLMVATIQGVLGALTLWIAGVHNIVLWGVVMTIIAIIPALGPALVLAPFSVWFLVSGNPAAAIIILIGIIVVSLVDNVLRPLLVGHETRLHDLLVLLSLLGGLSLWGMSGFVLGPVFAGLTVTLWNMYAEKYRSELTAD